MLLEAEISKVLSTNEAHADSKTNGNDAHANMNRHPFMGKRDFDEPNPPLHLGDPSDPTNGTDAQKRLKTE